MRPRKALQPLLEKLLAYLGYTSDNGWLKAEKFDDVGIHRFAMRQASEEMGVVGAFVWKGETVKSVWVTPLVYVATAENKSEAKTIHRKVWSQGLAPFLIILTSAEIITADGFRFSREEWDKDISTVTWDLLAGLSSANNSPSNDLAKFRASRIKTSLYWRDKAIEVSGRVDQYLLAGLEALSDALILGTRRSDSLPPSAANGLIGRFLYVLFLLDRGIINQQWLEDRGHGSIVVSDSSRDWSLAATWQLFDDLDQVFNGSIFPLTKADRKQIHMTHINLVRQVMRHGARLTSMGDMQLSFIDVDLGVVRVETLSAVYEQFLENIKSGERRKQGAFYTPPFLVDLILDKVEETKPLKDNVTVLDPASGSGVFLVGAYRRILENARRDTPNQSMDLDQVRGLLQRNIFGVERNIDACHVAAFSLYLTMLDYVRPRDLTRVAAGDDPTKLFPSLVGANIFAVDFFAGPAKMPALPKIQCALGNPPWQMLKKLESAPADDWLVRHPNSPVGNDQAAELFVWKTLRKHMTEDGFLAMLIPAKSFVNPTAYKFRQALMAEFTIVGAINFAHLRHRLFAGAKHACAALFVSTKAPAPSDWTWVYSPLSVGQPMPPKAWPWTLVMDKSEIQQFPHSRLAENSQSWFEAFMLRPVDRQILSFVRDHAEAGHIRLLGELCTDVCASVKRGGSPVETALSEAYLGSAASSAPEQSSPPTQKGTIRDLFSDDSVNAKVIEELPAAQLKIVSKNYKHQFSGNILLVPRKFIGIRFVPYPKGYQSSFLAVYFKKMGVETTTAERNFLKALGRYLSSKVAMYFMATGGRRWLMDRRNVEPADLQNFPVPFNGLDDPRVIEILTAKDEDLDKVLSAALGLSSDHRKAVAEFLEFRLQFKDGDVPAIALNKPEARMLGQYAALVKKHLGALIGRKDAFSVNLIEDTMHGVGVCVAKFIPSDEKPSDISSNASCEAALADYQSSAANSFTDGLSLRYDSDNSSVSVVKPLEYFRWTIDSAYADSRQMMDTFIKGTA